MTSILDTRIPLSRIQQLQSITPNLKRSIIFSHQKLPKDFFPSKLSIIKQSSFSKPRNNLLSQQIPRNVSNYEHTASNSKRQAMTARQNRPGKDQDLIMSVISASIEIKRVIRKNSMSLRRNESQVLSLSPQKTLRRSQIKQFELPPLLMKKAMTAGF